MSNLSDHPRDAAGRVIPMTLAEESAATGIPIEELAGEECDLEDRVEAFFGSLDLDLAPATSATAARSVASLGLVAS